MEARYKLRSPNLEIYERAKAFAERSGKVVVANPKRLALSVEVENLEALKPLEELGVVAVPDVRYDLESPE